MKRLVRLENKYLQSIMSHTRQDTEDIPVGWILQGLIPAEIFKSSWRDRKDSYVN